MGSSVFKGAATKAMQASGVSGEAMQAMKAKAAAPYNDAAMKAMDAGERPVKGAAMKTMEAEAAAPDKVAALKAMALYPPAKGTAMNAMDDIAIFEYNAYCLKLANRNVDHLVAAAAALEPTTMQAMKAKAAAPVPKAAAIQVVQAKAATTVKRAAMEVTHAPAKAAAMKAMKSTAAAPAMRQLIVKPPPPCMFPGHLQRLAKASLDAAKAQAAANRQAMADEC